MSQGLNSWFKSLRGRMLLLETLSIVIIVLGAIVIEHIYSRRVVLDEIVKSANATGSIIRAAITSRRAPSQGEIQNLILHLGGSIAGLRTIYVVNATGVIVAHSDPKLAGLPAQEPEVKEALRTGSDSQIAHQGGISPSHPESADEPEHMHFVFPIRSRSGEQGRSAIVGAVVMDIDVAEAGASIFSGFRGLLVAIIALVLFFFGAQFLLLRGSYRRLNLLSRAAERFGKGDYSVRVQPGGPAEIYRLVAVMNNVADHVQEANAQLRAAKEKAEAATVAKTRFLTNMSHEIRTPLTGIIGYAGLALEDRSLIGETRRYINHVFSASNNLRAIIDDILDLSKIESGKIELVPRPFSIYVLIDDCAALAESIAKAKGLTLIRHVDAALPHWVSGDAVRTQQVLLNLINNALKFTERGSVEIGVDLERRFEGKATVRFYVRDTGIGVAEDVFPLLFQRFQQADDSFGRRYGGAGLGLAISKSLVSMMHGEIGVDSGPGKGSTFWFRLTLPITSAPEAEEEKKPFKTPAAQLKILVVDDSEMNADLVQTLLRRMGHVVDKVFDGPASVQACAKEKYDLVFMDIQMPGTDGMEATRQIRALNEYTAHMPIVAMTANVMADQIEMYRQAGLTDFIGKPIDRDRLHAIVDGVANASLREVPKREEIATSPPQAADKPVFDKVMLDDVRESLGAEKTRYHLERLAESLASDVWEGRGDRDELMKRAHKTISLGGQLGFSRLAAAAYDLENAIRHNDKVEAALTAFNDARAASQPVLQGLMLKEGSAAASTQNPAQSIAGEARKSANDGG